MKRDMRRPAKGRIAFEFVSPHGIPDDDELHVTEPGALVLYSRGLWSVIGSRDAEEVAVEVLKARGKWSETEDAMRNRVEMLQEALRMAKEEILEHAREYHHVTNPEKLRQIDDALRGHPMGQLELFEHTGRMPEKP